MRVNPFDGKGVYTKFVWDVYKRMMRREWFSHADVMADRMGLESADKLPFSVSKCRHNGELRKAFLDVCSLLKERVGDSCIETSGNNRDKRFRYVGEEENPLEDLQNASAIRDIQVYAKFCQDSAGFFPSSWLEYFFEDSLDLLDMKKRKNNSEQTVVSSLDRELRNIELLPILYEAIRDKAVLSINYQPYGEEPIDLEFHPHLLKEYNGRWFLFGHAKSYEPHHGFNLPLDRMEGEPSRLMTVKYESAPKGFYQSFFKNIVGVSHYKDSILGEILLKTHSRKIFNLISTKKIHGSQGTVKPFGTHEDGEYGLISLYVEVNPELIGRILQMGPDLEVVGPPEFRQMIQERTLKMAALYCESDGKQDDEKRRMVPKR